MRLWALLLAAAIAGGQAWAAGVRNPTNDSLLAMPEKQRIEMLAGLTHKKCVGTRAFMMGMTPSGPARGTAYWSIACEDGHSYVIQINRDKKGTSFVADCKALEGSGRECFARF